jgi:hypothetical protein
VTTILDSPVVVVVPGPVQPTVIVSPPSAPTTIVQPQGPPGLPGGAPNPIVYELAAVSSWSPGPRLRLPARRPGSLT